MTEKVYNVGGTLRVIYAYSTPDVPKLAGMLKVGDTEVKASTIEEATIELQEMAASHRIGQQVNTAVINIKIEGVFLALKKDANGNLSTFRDHDVHNVLERSGIKRFRNRTNDPSLQVATGKEWFENITSADVEAAVEAIKRGDDSIPKDYARIKLYPNQKQAVKKTEKVFENGNLMLWDCKPRFGKTLTTYELIKSMGLNKVLITTNRPDVNSGWYQDFKKMRMEELGYKYASKQSKLLDSSGSEKLIQFASLQDLKGSWAEGEEQLLKNEEIFNTEWDLIISDEVHEGWLTELGIEMLKRLKFSKQLHLSGTPYNVSRVSQRGDFVGAEFFDYDGVYSWDYVDEQKAKREWPSKHPGKPNPYDVFPEMVLMGMDLTQVLSEHKEELEALADEGRIPTIKLSKFFATNAFGKFVHEDLVIDLMRKISGDRMYSTSPESFPFNILYSPQFDHTFWVLPNVQAVNALEKLFKENITVGFQGFTIVNATGDGNLEENTRALERVKEAVRGEKSITLSQQMLTTGISVPEWTAVFQLNDSTSDIKWMQSGLRASTPGLLKNGQQKAKFYIFDFAPNRTLQTIENVAKSRVAGELKDPIAQHNLEEETLRELLEYIPINSYREGNFVPLEGEEIIAKLSELAASEVAETGFASPRLFNSIALQNYDISKASLLNALRKMQGGSPGGKGQEVKVGPSNTAEAKAILEALERKAKAAKKTPDSGLELTPEEEEQLGELRKVQKEEQKAEQKNRANAIKILTGITVRIPLIVFAEPPERTITAENFNELLDDESWAEFMPKGLERIKPGGVVSFEERAEEALSIEGLTLYWEDVARFFDPQVFRGASEVLRGKALAADSHGPLERAVLNREILNTVRNPDKETVLTPSRVVDLHYSRTLGGLVFTDLEESTSTSILILTRDKEGNRESVPIGKISQALENGSTLAPLWIKSDGTALEVDGEISESLREMILEDGFWGRDSLTILDPNSKTALYPLYGAVSRFFVKALKSGVDPFSNSDEAWSLYEEVVASEIFFNARVPYSRSIGQRVLLRGDSSVEVNASIFDLVSFKKAWQWWNKNCEASFTAKRSPKWWAKRADLPKDAGMVMQLANPVFVERPGIPRVFAGLMSNRVGELLEEVDKMELDKEEDLAILEKRAEALTELFGLIDSAEGNRFDAVVGNPPYQIDTEGKNQRSLPIWQDFFYASQKIAKKVSIIAPARWRNAPTNAEKKIRENLIKYQNSILLVDIVDPSEGIFPGTLIRGGVGIIFWNENTPSENLPKVVINGEDLGEINLIELIWPKESLEIFEKIALPAVKFENYVDGIDRSRLRRFTKNFSKEKTETHTIRTLAVYGGLGKGQSWGYLEKKAWNRNPDRLFAGYKFGAYCGASDIRSITTGLCYGDSVLLEKDEMMGEGGRWIIFPTKEQALNFKSYFETNFTKAQVISTIKGRGNAYSDLVPDLSSITNPRTGLVGWESDWTDADLKELFKDILTDNDWKYIVEKTEESVASVNTSISLR